MGTVSPSFGIRCKVGFEVRRTWPWMGCGPGLPSSGVSWIWFLIGKDGERDRHGMYSV